MLTKIKISGQILNWYQYTGYLIKTDQPLTAQNNVLVVCLPGQGQLSTDVTFLDQVVPANVFNSGKLPEKTADGKFITYVVPEFPHWVNVDDVVKWIETILPTLNIPYAKIGMYGLSLGGLGIGYFAQATSVKHFDFAFFNDGCMSGMTTAHINAIVANISQLQLISDDLDTTVPELSNSLNVFTQIKALWPAYPANFVHLPGAAHDTWDHSWDPANTGADSFFVFLNSISAATAAPAPAPVPVPVVPAPISISIPTALAAGVYTLNKQ